jgi:hypothetical protein
MPPAKRSRGLLDDYPAARPYVEPLAQALFGQGPVLNLLGVEPTGPSAWQMVQSHDPQAMQELAAGFAGTVTPAKGIRAFHGSPHDFDKFSLSKIGTGEGAQAYGHGLYFAENEGVARSYRDQLTGGNLVLRDGTVLKGDAMDGAEGIAARYLSMHDGNLSSAKEQLRASSLAPERKQAVEAAMDDFSARGAGHYPGRMYEVEIKADPESLLDWDAPLSQQPKITEAIRNSPRYQELAASRHFGYSPEEFAALPSERRAELVAKTPQSIHENILFPERPGRGLYDSMGEPQQAAEVFKEAGIPGLRYLDGGSRKAGDGSRNIVMFDDSLVEILRKYGLAGLTSAGGLLGAKEYVDRKGLLDG